MIGAHAVGKLVGEVELVEGAQHRFEVGPHVDHLVEHDQLARAADVLRSRYAQCFSRFSGMGW